MVASKLKVAFLAILALQNGLAGRRDESFASVVASAQAIDPALDWTAAKSDLESLRKWMVGFRERKPVLSMLRSERPASSVVSVEIVRPLGTRYEAIVAVRNELAATMTCWERGHQWQAPLSENDWQALSDRAFLPTMRTLVGRQVVDGFAVFVLTMREGSSRRYALYSPVLSTHMTDLDRRLNAAMARELALVEYALLLRDKVRPQRR